MAPIIPQVLAEGRLFEERWRVVRCLRTGGMGAVYEVEHVETLARSALKVLLPELVTSAELRARFLQEVMVTAKIESDHIVKVFDGGTDAETGAPFLVMELLRGEDLGARVARGPMPSDEVVLLLGQAARALERTHAAGVVHRDLKPANLFVTTRDDGSPCLKVLDYGIAKVVASVSQAETTRAVGTPLYMAPEQVKGDGTIAAPADLYALAQIAYTLLVGEAYWSADQGESKNVYPLLMAIAAGATEAASARAARAGVELPAAFDAWFERATAVDPGERFASAREMIAELERALDGAPPTRSSSAPNRERRTRDPAKWTSSVTPTVSGVAGESLRPQRSRVLTIGTGLAVVGALGAFAWSAFGGAREEGTAGAQLRDTTTEAAPPSSAPPPPAALASASSSSSAAPGAPATTAAAAESAKPPAPAASERASARPPSPRASVAQPTSSVKVAPEPPPAPDAPSDPSDEYRKGTKP